MASDQRTIISDIKTHVASNGAQRLRLGAHVQKDRATDKSWYIVPLCNDHNSQTGESLDIMDSTMLVSANASQTCGKK
jgi:hypothetical protein